MTTMTTVVVRWLILALATVALWQPAAASDQAKTLQSLKLALPDRGFRHAGYYVALDKGYFKEAGLDVELEESANPISALVKGGAAFAVSGVEALVYRASGLPIVSVAAVFQHAPFAVATRPEKTIELTKLSGTPVYREKELPALEAFLKSRQIAAELKLDEQSLAKFIDGELGAVLVSTADERISVQNAHFPVALLSPDLAGVDLYGDILLTRSDRLETDKKTVLAFREAAIRGWKQALAHVDETLDLIDQKHPTGRPRSHARQEAAVIAQLVQAEWGDIGRQDVQRWAETEKMFLDAGLIKSPAGIKQFVFDPGANSLPPWARQTLLIGTPAFAVIMLLAWRLRSATRQLRASREENEKSLGALKAQALWDSLTELHNRRYFEPNLERELARARRKKEKVALIMLDIDLLKRVNDRWGVASGDAALKFVAKTIRQNCRPEDMACRYEEAEMVILMPGSSLDSARQFAETLRETIESTPISANDGDFYITVSSGVTLWPDFAGTPKALIDSARRSLYAAKSAGRNRVALAHRNR